MARAERCSWRTSRELNCHWQACDLELLDACDPNIRSRTRPPEHRTFVPDAEVATRTLSVNPVSLRSSIGAADSVEMCSADRCMPETTRHVETVRERMCGSSRSDSAKRVSTTCTDSVP